MTVDCIFGICSKKLNFLCILCLTYGYTYSKINLRTKQQNKSEVIQMNPLTQYEQFIQKQNELKEQKNNGGNSK